MSDRCPLGFLFEFSQKINSLFRSTLTPKTFTFSFTSTLTPPTRPDPPPPPHPLQFFFFLYFHKNLNSLFRSILTHPLTRPPTICFFEFSQTLHFFSHIQSDPRPQIQAPDPAPPPPHMKEDLASAGLEPTPDTAVR